MPKLNSNAINKNKSSASKSRADKGQEDLWEFEQFVQKPPAAVRRRPWLLVAVFLIIIIVLAAALFYSVKLKNPAAPPLSFKAIYLDSGQVYYAKLIKEDELNLYLDDVYYVDTQQQTVPASEEGGEAQTITVPVLVKRSEASYKPEGWLQINRQKVVALESLSSDSQIIQEINRLNQK